MAVCGVLGAVFPRHLEGAFIFVGVGVFLILCLLGAAVGVRTARPRRVSEGAPAGSAVRTACQLTCAHLRDRRPLCRVILSIADASFSNSGRAVHLYYSKKAHHSLAACINGGHSRYFSFIGGKKFAGICGGGWSGTFYYGVPGTSISGSANFSPGYLPSFWKQTDVIYGVRLDRYEYIQGFTSCPAYGS
jgi:hypothetical protein